MIEPESQPSVSMTATCGQNPLWRHGTGRVLRAACPVLLMVGLLLLTACRSARPGEPYELGEAETPRVPASAREPRVVYATSAMTNSLQHVTYTFDLPRLPEQGYIVEESYDGREWSVLGRSKSTNLRQVTVVDATPNSGKLWRVILP